MGRFPLRQACIGYRSFSNAGHSAGVLTGRGSVVLSDIPKSILVFTALARARGALTRTAEGPPPYHPGVNAMARVGLMRSINQMALSPLVSRQSMSPFAVSDRVCSSMALGCV
jgi:hypothetical protein